MSDDSNSWTWVQPLFTESFYDANLPRDILLLIANSDPFCWYVIAVANKDGAKYAKEKSDEKKLEFSKQFLSVQKNCYQESCFRLPNMKRHGSYVKTAAKSRVEGKYLDGEKTGIWRTWDSDVLVEEREYRNNLLDGKSTTWNGSTREIVEESWRRGKKICSV